MAVKLSTEKVKVKNGIIGKRRRLDNPVEDLISSSGIRIKSYDKAQINIKRYLSSEDIRIFQDMPQGQRQQVIGQFMSSTEYSKLEEAVRESYTGNFIQDSIPESSHNHKNKINYYDDYSYVSIPESRKGTVSLSEDAYAYTNTGDISTADEDELKDNFNEDKSDIVTQDSGAVNNKPRTRIRLSQDDVDDKNIKSSNNVTEKTSGTKTSYADMGNYYRKTNNSGAEASVTNVSEGAAADTAATASTAGTSKVVKAAEQAVKKYADIIKTATGQEETESSTQQNENETSITSNAGFMKRAAVIITTVATAVASYLSAAFMPVIALIMCVVVAATLLVSVISSVAGVITNTVNKAISGIKMQLLSENTISYTEDLREAAGSNDITDYVNYLIAIMEVESHGNGNDPMQSSESAGLPPDSFDNPQDSIRQGAYYFAGCIKEADEQGCDLMTAVQSYNYGQGFINYVADNGGQYTLELAISFAKERSGGIQVDYSNQIAVDYNGGWRYAYGNMFYAQLVNQYIYSYEDEAVQKIVDEAMKYYGWEYTWGGSNPEEGFDCSGLVQWCYLQAGIELPRTSREQFEWCEEITVDELKAGDLLFYQNESSGGEIGHVAIYIGDDKVYEAGDPIGVYDNNDSWHQDNLLYAGRIIHFEPEENIDE